MLDYTLLDELMELGLFDSAVAIAVSRHRHINLVLEVQTGGPRGSLPKCLRGRFTLKL